MRVFDSDEVVLGHRPQVERRYSQGFRVNES
jgi:hypothetical protein